MNGAIYDSTFNLFFKLQVREVLRRRARDAPLRADVAVGEIGLGAAARRVYSASFLSDGRAGADRVWWALLALPAAVLIGFAFAAAGLAATTYMRGWQDFDFVQLAMLPLFLFSTTFYPLSTYPGRCSWSSSARRSTTAWS